MSENIFVYILLFLSVTLLVLGLYQYYGKDRAAQKKVNHRLSLIEQIADRNEVLKILQQERGLGGRWSPHELLGLQDLVVQSGIRLQNTQFLVSMALLSCGVTSALTIIFGFQFYTLPLSLVITLVILFAWLTHLRARRIARFSEQLPDCLDTIVRSLRAGHPVPVALSLVGREMADPAGTEFGVASDEVTFGLSITGAMENLASRAGAPDLLYLVTAISVQSESGGNLSEVLSRLSKLIRERFRMRRKVKTLTSEGRASAVILTILPIALFLLINLISPKYFGDVWNEPGFRKAAIVSGVLLVIGNYIMRQMVNFKF
jgi:tight adherence protein B